MKLSKDQVTRIAELAQLKIPSEQVESVRADLQHIIELVSQMQTIDTENIQPLSHPYEDNVLTLRDDQVTEVNQREQLQHGAPDVMDGLYIVPPVIEDE